MSGLFLNKIIYDIIVNENITQKEIEQIRNAPVLSSPQSGDFEEYDDGPFTDLFTLPTVIFKLNATAGEAVNLYIAGDGYRITGEALGFSFDKQAVSELGLYDPEIFQLVRHVPSNTFYFERVVLGTFQNDTQLAEHYELSNPDDVTYVQLSTVLPQFGVLNG